MFKKLSSLFRDLLMGRAAADQEAARKVVKSGRPSSSVGAAVRVDGKQVPAPLSGGDEKRKRKRRKRSGRKNPENEPVDVPPLNKAGIPAMPEELREVAVVEGKTRFLDLALPRSVQCGLQDLKFEYCTPIQSVALPALLAGRDVCGKAQTGTGKTAAFLLAIFKYLLDNPLSERKNGSCRALVLAPTRELAIQIHKDAELLGKYTGLHNVVVFGGMEHRKQEGELNRPVDILIGTPGRIIDFSRSGTLDLSRAEVLVIDEADRMLDMGFIPDVRRIVAQLPGRGKRQTMLFSATLDETILRLAANFLSEPEMLESEPESMVGDNIDQTFYTVSGDEKLALIIYLLTHLDYERVMIFGNRKCDNLDLQRDLARYGVRSALLSGDIAQEKRLKILEAFRSGREKVLIATDVAARGIHVDNVSLVINYDLPDRPEDYVHRIGRTGRAGKRGTSLSLLDEYGSYALPAIEEMLGREFHSIFPEDEMVTLPEPVSDPSVSVDRRHVSRNRRNRRG